MAETDAPAGIGRCFTRIGDTTWANPLLAGMAAVEWNLRYAPAVSEVDRYAAAAAIASYRALVEKTSERRAEVVRSLRAAKAQEIADAGE